MRHSPSNIEATSWVKSNANLLDKFVDWARQVELPSGVSTEIGVERKYENVAWLRINGSKTFTVISLQSNGYYSFESLGLEKEEPLLTRHKKLEPSFKFGDEFAEVLDFVLLQESI